MSARAQSRVDRAPVLVFAIMVSSVMVMPAIRPLLAARGATESSMHAFLSVAMLGAAIGAPLVAALTERWVNRRALVAMLVAFDAAAALACVAPMPVALLMSVRALQGAANVGALSIAMSFVGPPHAAAGAMAARGSAMMLALVVGSPLGGILLTYGHAAPFVAASVTLLGSLAASLQMESREPPTPRQARVDLRALAASPAIRIAAAVAFVERFTIGTFVVTFAVHAHGALGWSDRQIAMAYAAMLVPFALATYPIARLGNVLSRERSIVVGCVVYGAAFAAFGVLNGASLVAALVVAGVGSALLYAPALCLAASGPRESRATAMASFHAAGCLGMMLGTAAAGIVSAVLRRASVADVARHATVFALGASAVLVLVVFLGLALRRAAATSVRAEGCDVPRPPLKGETP